MTETATDGMVRRYDWRFHEGYEEEQCIDRASGDVIIAYDAGDPANWNPAYGGWSKRKYLENKGCDPDAELLLSQCKVSVSPHEVEGWARVKEAKARRKQEEAEAQDLLDFLGDDAKAFDFGEWDAGEDAILKPALETRGYTNVAFHMVEQDSFGPLIRGVIANDPSGKRVRFYYG